MEDKNNQNTINFNKNKSQGSAMDGSNKTFRSAGVVREENKIYNIKQNVFLPFVSGIVGAGIVIGTCFGVPGIKNSIIGNNDNNYISTQANKSSGEVNTNLISLEGFSETAVGVANKVLPSIVGITVEYPVNSIFMMQSGTAEAEGSGIIISNDGYILTNNHVINSASTSSSYYYEIGQANKVEVYLYNEETPYTATVVGTDEETDLAVIKIEGDNFTAAELGDSDTLQVGEFVMAIGNPLGMKSSVTSGIVSAVDREVTDSDGKVYKLIQTDTAINSGNSGGALVNSKGKVIGINTLKVSETGVEGMGFAIPVNSAQPIYEQLIQYNKVKRPAIGISGRDITENLAKRYKLVEGVYVMSVEEFSGAERAGIKVGDVIVKADDETVKTMTELNAIKNKHAIGEEIKLTVNREGKEFDVNVKLGEQ